MSVEVDIGFASQRGPRTVNEDFAGAVHAPADEAERGVVAAVADGVSMGGGGLIAAQTTVMGLLNDYFSVPDHWESTVVMERLIGAQNAWLAQHNRTAQTTALSTLTVLSLRGQTWTVGHVGDSRAWLLRRGGPDWELSLLTQDHAFDHPDQRSRLTRAVGLDDVVRIDYQQGEVRVGDCFVLTTDGVHQRLKATHLAQLAVGAIHAQGAADALVAAALAAGGNDNATALVLRVTGLDSRGLLDALSDSRNLPVPGRWKVGQVVDAYQVVAVVADTAVHLLYQARDLATGELVAIKALHPSRASDPEERALLAHEAWLGQRIAEREARNGWVRVRPRRPDASAWYVVFDWHEGRTLAQWMRDTPRPEVAEVVEAAVQWVKALAQLHRMGVVHRDIKPENLHRGGDGVWRVLDLGAALSARTTPAQRALHMGTPSYMNPEQWTGEGAAAGSDLFAVGVTLYQWLTGRLPYGEIEPYQTARYKRDLTPVTRYRPDVPIWLDHLIAKALTPQAAQRFETAEELLLALERGASRPLAAPGATPLLVRGREGLLIMALAVSLLFNLLLVLWLLFLPRG